MEEQIRKLLKALKEDPHREGLTDTPKRWVKAMHELTAGYEEKLEDIVDGALFPPESSEMVTIKDIGFYSLCEHHLLPFIGKVHVGYIPGKHLVGFSKIPRIVEMYAKRLQTQERLGQQICDAVMQVASPEGVGVIIEAEHLCMTMRGIQKEGSKARTHHFAGRMQEGVSERQEFFAAMQ